MSFSIVNFFEKRSLIESKLIQKFYLDYLHKNAIVQPIIIKIRSFSA